jgi:hypothetical protein
MTNEVDKRIKLLLADGWTQMGVGEGSLFYKDDLVIETETLAKWSNYAKI